jgi:hypothetical protein
MGIGGIGMKYTITIIRKTYYDFEVEANDEDMAIEAGYEAYSEAVDNGTINEHYGDEDIDYDNVYESED